MKHTNDYKKITKRITNFISKKQGIKANEETVSLLLSMLSNFDNGNKGAIDVLSGVCSYIFFNIPESPAILPDLSATLLLGADLAWHFHQNPKKESSFEQWKKLFANDLLTLKNKGKIRGSKELYKEILINGKNVLIKYPSKKAD